MPIPEVPRERILEALRIFDERMRESYEWRDWEARRKHKYALEYEGKHYPVREVIHLAIGSDEFPGGRRINEHLSRLGFKVAKVHDDQDMSFEFEERDLVEGISGTRWRSRLKPILEQATESALEIPLKAAAIALRPQIYIFDEERKEILKNNLMHPKFHFELEGERRKYHYGMYIEKGLQEHKDPNQVMDERWAWRKFTELLNDEHFVKEFMDILAGNDLEICCTLYEPDEKIFFRPKGSGLTKIEPAKKSEEEISLGDFADFLSNIPKNQWCDLHIRKLADIGPDRRIPIQPIIETYEELASILFSILPIDANQKSANSEEGTEGVLRSLLETKKQIIFYGPPGTGKTYAADQLAREFVHDESGLFRVTFHPAFGYEEFVEGITVNIEDEEGKSIGYCLREGIFKKACKHALGIALGYRTDELEKLAWARIFQEYRARNESGSASDFTKNVVMVIDEINRGDIAKIFGELVTLLEADKRLGAENETTVTLPYSNDIFGVPPNLYIIGTMNTADVSIALVDIALRRRFAFCEMMPDLDDDGVLLTHHRDKGTLDLVLPSVKALRIINERISRERSLGRDKQIGHSFLFGVEDRHDLYRLWRYEILPLLEEYFYGDYSHINEILFGDGERTYCMDPVKGIVLIPEKLDEMINGILESSVDR